MVLAVGVMGPVESVEEMVAKEEAEVVEVTSSEVEEMAWETVGVKEARDAPECSVESCSCTRPQAHIERRKSRTASLPDRRDTFHPSPQNTHHLFQN